MLFQLVNKHKKINNVVKITKNKEIPSIPTVKFKFKLGNHRIFSTNWKFPVDLSNKTHKNKESKNVMLEKNKAILFNKFLFHEGVNNNKQEPNKGNNNK